jgi:monoamine oxidase
MLIQHSRESKLYFVGEYALIFTEVPVTMEAACESGDRVARMILKTL